MKSENPPKENIQRAATLQSYMNREIRLLIVGLIPLVILGWFYWQGYPKFPETFLQTLLCLFAVILAVIMIFLDIWLPRYFKKKAQELRKPYPLIQAREVANITLPNGRKCSIHLEFDIPRDFLGRTSHAVPPATSALHRYFRMTSQLPQNLFIALESYLDPFIAKSLDDRLPVWEFRIIDIVPPPNRYSGDAPLPVGGSYPLYPPKK